MFKISTFKSGGFTLIELMIVMVILGVSMSLIGPNILNTVEKQPVNLEKKITQMKVEYIAVLALSKSRELVVELKGKQIEVFMDDKLLETHITEHLFFEGQQLVVSKNGFVSTNEIAFVFRQTSGIIELELPVYSEL